MSDDYELISRKELQALKKEVAELKARPTQPPSADLMQALDRLSGHIQRLTKLFEHADKELAQEYHKGTHKKAEKLDLVIAQNEQLAKGLLHMSDLIQKQAEVKQRRYPLRSEPKAQEPSKATPKTAPKEHEDFPTPAPVFDNKAPKPPSDMPTPPNVTPQAPPSQEASSDLPPPPELSEQEQRTDNAPSQAPAPPPKTPDSHLPPAPDVSEQPTPQDAPSEIPSAPNLSEQSAEQDTGSTLPPPPELDTPEPARPDLPEVSELEQAPQHPPSPGADLELPSEAHPREIDEQMSTLPPPSDMDDPMRQEELPSANTPKRSRKSLMRSFK